MKQNWSFRDFLLFAVLVLLLIDIGTNISSRFFSAETPQGAETSRIDDCITVNRADKPLAYLHVVTHGPRENIVQ